MIKIYKSTAGCGYNKYAYVTPIKDNDYLCIWTNENTDYPTHVEGEIIKDLEDIYLEEVDINSLPSDIFLYISSYLNKL